MAYPCLDSDITATRENAEAAILWGIREAESGINEAENGGHNDYVWRPPMATSDDGTTFIPCAVDDPAEDSMEGAELLVDELDEPSPSAPSLDRIVAELGFGLKVSRYGPNELQPAELIPLLKFTRWNMQMELNVEGRSLHAVRKWCMCSSMQCGHARGGSA